MNEEIKEIPSFLFPSSDPTKLFIVESTLNIYFAQKNKNHHEIILKWCFDTMKTIGLLAYSNTNIY